MVVTEKHCVYCFDVLYSHFDPTHVVVADFKDDAYPLFVTWKIRKQVVTTASVNKRGKVLDLEEEEEEEENNDSNDDNMQLRGCIGNFTAQSLHRGLREYALTSALKDRRFSPISHKELPYLSCSVSLLTDFITGDNYLDWEIGTHGVWIEFKDDYGHRCTATYLPEIAEEQEWTKEETIRSLLRKGGYRGKITAEKLASVKLTRYQSKKYSLSYKKYLAYRAERTLASTTSVITRNGNSNGIGTVHTTLFIDSKRDDDNDDNDDNDHKPLKRVKRAELIKQQA
ncbi:AMMECR1 domain-containing protein [Syncephalis plumigaleata]|nr:AMMECR1 domain-containing protein [Syncephalis plumigaleata]